MMVDAERESPFWAGIEKIEKKISLFSYVFDVPVIGGSLDFRVAGPASAAPLHIFDMQSLYGEDQSRPPLCRNLTGGFWKRL